MKEGGSDLVVVSDSKSLCEALSTTGNIKDRRCRIDRILQSADINEE